MKSVKIEEVSNIKTASSLEKEKVQLRERIEVLEDKLNQKQNEIDNGKRMSDEAAINMEKERKDFKQMIQDREMQISRLTEKLEGANVKKILFKDFPLSIDGSTMELEDDGFYIEYDNDIYLSSNLLKKLYGDDFYGVVVRGIPYEKHLIKSDAYVSVELIAESTGIYDEFEKQSKEGKYDTLESSLDGIKFYVSEAGTGFSLTKAIYTTIRGITIGSTKVDVIKAYGRLGDMESKEWRTFRGNVEYSEGGSLTFIFDDNDKVIEIKG